METRAWICNAEVEEILGLTEGSARLRLMYTFYSANNRMLACVESIASASATLREIKLEW